MRSRLLALVFLAFAITVVGCIEPKSMLRIDSGKFIDKNSKDPVPGVMWLGMCTATAVSHNTLIFAAHCVVETGQIVTPVVCIKSGTMAKDKCSVALYVPDEYKNGTLNQSPQSMEDPYNAKDVAVAVFPDHTFSQFFELNNTLPSAGMKVTMVGYSKENLPANSADRGTKRWGSNVILSTNNDSRSTILTEYHHTAESVALSPGDSGGPLMIDCKVAGVASRGGQDPNSAYKLSLHTNLMADDQDYLKSLEAKGAYFCGFSGSDPQKCPVDGQAKPISPTDPEQYPCASATSANASSAGANPTPTPVPAAQISDNVLLAMNPDTQSHAPVFLSFNQHLDEVLVCLKDRVADCNTAEYPVVFISQVNGRYIYATTRMVDFSSNLKLAVHGKIQSQSIVGRVIAIDRK